METAKPLSLDPINFQDIEREYVEKILRNTFSPLTDTEKATLKRLKAIQEGLPSPNPIGLSDKAVTYLTITLFGIVTLQYWVALDDPLSKVLSTATILFAGAGIYFITDNPRLRRGCIDRIHLCEQEILHSLEKRCNEIANYLLLNQTDPDLQALCMTHNIETLETYLKSKVTQPDLIPNALRSFREAVIRIKTASPFLALTPHSPGATLTTPKLPSGSFARRTSF